jgi:hypothetical protein
MGSDAFRISRKALVSMVSQLVGGYPNPEDPDPPGPWGPVIRRAVDRVRWVSGPHPEPWLEVALNPQPLPPRIALAVSLAQAVVDRAISLHEVAEVLPDQTTAINAASAMMSRFIDDCGNGRIPPWKRWPFPWPPRDDLDEAITPLELVVMGVQFENAVGFVESRQLQEDLRRGGAQLMEMGLERM